jgi:hypothetical protein
MDRPRFSKCNGFHFLVRALYLYGLYHVLFGLMQRIGLIAIAVCVVGSISEAGELDNLKGEVRYSDFPSPSQEKKDCDDDHHRCHRCGCSTCCCHDSCAPHVHADASGNSVTDGVSAFIGGILVSPIMLTTKMVEGNSIGALYFAPAPYMNTDGAMVRAHDYPDYQQTNRQLTFEYGSDYDDMQRYGIRLLRSSTTRWDVDMSFDYLSEALPVSGDDNLVLGDVNLVCRFAENKHLQLRAGLGVNYLVEDDWGRAGVNFTVSLDVFPVKPWRVFANLDWGQIGHAPYIHVNSGIGFVRDRMEFFGGIDYREIGDAEFAGPMMGLRFYF